MWGTLFFVFMSFAALSTVIAVFEGILRFSMDQWGWSRKRAVTVNLIAIPLLSLPCALGFNVLSDVVMPGVGDIQTVEDFLVSSNIMPLGRWSTCCSACPGAAGLEELPCRGQRGRRTQVPPVAAPVDALRRAGARGHHSHHGWVPIVSSWL